jgi:putative phosphoesterase
MLLGILADSHNHLPRTRAAVEILVAAGAEVLVHCGDLATPEIVAACAVRPFYFVFGNHDADSVPHLEEAARQCGATCLQWGGVIQLAGKKIGVIHGHLATDRRRVEALAPDYILSGHCHAAFDFVDGGIRRINPGALFRASEFSVALLDLTSNELRFLPVPR